MVTVNKYHFHITWLGLSDDFQTTFLSSSHREARLLRATGRGSSYAKEKMTNRTADRPKGDAVSSRHLPLTCYVTSDRSETSLWPPTLPNCPTRGNGTVKLKASFPLAHFVSEGVTSHGETHHLVHCKEPHGLQNSMLMKCTVDIQGS